MVGLLSMVLTQAGQAHVPTGFDCGMRALAMKYAHEIQPFRPLIDFQDAANALNGAPEAQDCNVSAIFAADAQPFTEKNVPKNHAFSVEVVVSDVNGTDSNAGTIAYPLRTVAAAVQMVRSKRKNASDPCDLPAAVLVRAGTYHLTTTIELAPMDSCLTIQAYESEEVWLSGAVPLQGLAWREATGPPQVANLQQQAPPVFVASLAGQDLAAADLDALSGGLQGFGLRLKGRDSIATNTRDDDGRRAIPARYPNADPELGFGSTLTAQSWLAPAPSEPPKDLLPPSGPIRNGTTKVPLFTRFVLGVGGSCEGRFEQSAGFWCASFDVLGGGGDDDDCCGVRGGAKPYMIPSGIAINATAFPHLPHYNRSSLRYAEVHAWRKNHWESWLFEVEFEAEAASLPEGEPTPNTDGAAGGNAATVLRFGRGGFQGARGDREGEEVLLQHVWQELDYPTEFYFDRSRQLLYYSPNTTHSNHRHRKNRRATETAPPHGTFEATRLARLINVQGTYSHAQTLAQAGPGTAEDSLVAPVRNVSLIGLGLRDTRATYLSPHTMPSGGDWAIHRGAALMADGVSGLTVTDCRFWRVDGTALMVAGYGRGVQVRRNHFKWIGENAIVLWGNTSFSGSTPFGASANANANANSSGSGSGSSNSYPTGFGPDGTHGLQPRGTLIERNWGSEVGVFEKQTAIFTSFKSAGTTLTGNVFFNCPVNRYGAWNISVSHREMEFHDLHFTCLPWPDSQRAAINWDDGFGGGNLISHNLAFNTCRESGNHGVYNSWDRQPYSYLDIDVGLDDNGAKAVKAVQAVKTVKTVDVLERNFFISNYNSGFAIDNDDGSQYYLSRNNFLVYGGTGMKSDFGGHDNTHIGNIYAYVSSHCLLDAYDQAPGHANVYSNNTCVMLNSLPYALFGGWTNTPYADHPCPDNETAIMPKMRSNKLHTPTGSATVCNKTLAEFQAEGYEEGTSVGKWPNDDELLGWARQTLWSTD